MNTESVSFSVKARNYFKAILKGKFLIQAKVSDYLVHILYVFVLFTLVIWVSMMIDFTLAKVERNKRSINELEIVYSDMKFREAEATSRKKVEENLILLGSEVCPPEVPATVIDNGR